MLNRKYKKLPYILMCPRTQQPEILHFRAVHLLNQHSFPILVHSPTITFSIALSVVLSTSIEKCTIVVGHCFSIIPSCSIALKNPLFLPIHHPLSTGRVSLSKCNINVTVQYVAISDCFLSFHNNHVRFSHLFYGLIACCR